MAQCSYSRHEQHLTERLTEQQASGTQNIDDVVDNIAGVWNADRNDDDERAETVDETVSASVSLASSMHDAAAADNENDDIVSLRSCRSFEASSMSSMPSQLPTMNMTDETLSVSNRTGSYMSGQLSAQPSALPSPVSAVRESTSSNVSQQTVYHRSPDLSGNTPSHCSSTQSADSASVQTSVLSSLSSVSSASSPVFAGIEIPQREYPAELRERQYDAVLISTREDEHIATVFKHILTQYITLEVCAFVLYISSQSVK